MGTGHRDRRLFPLLLAAVAAVPLAALAPAEGPPDPQAESAGPSGETGDLPDPYAGLHPYTGDIHVHTGLALYMVLDPNRPHAIGTPDQVLDAAESRGLDFVVITEHSNNLNDPRGVQWRREVGAAFTLPDGTITAEEWVYLQSVVARRNKPGRFLVFLGLEYTHGSTKEKSPGHQAAIFPGDTLPRYCSNFPHNVGDCPEHADFYRFVREQGGVAVMAHPCTKSGPSDWSAYDPIVNAMELVEGKCEFGPNGYNDMLKRGLRLGARGSSDSHHFEVGAADKTICWASALTRPAILDAMRANLCYYADRFPVALKFTINGAPMGSEIAAEGLGLAVSASAQSPWDTDCDHMELIHDGKVVVRKDCEDNEYDECAMSTLLLDGAPGYYYVALSSESGRRIAVSSPIWVGASR